MSNEMVVYGQSSMSLEEMKVRANILVTSGLLPAHFKTPQQVIAAMMYAQDLGLPPAVAVNVLYPLPNGTIGTDTKTMLALCYRSGLIKGYTYEVDSKGAVTVKVKRKDLEDPIHFRFGDDEAKAAGLYDRPTYRAHRRTMYIWRATAGALRIAFPDVIFGLYDREEFGESPSIVVQPAAPPIIDGEVTEVISDWYGLFETIQRRHNVSAKDVFVHLQCENVPALSAKFKSPQDAYDAFVAALRKDAENAKVAPVLTLINNVFGEINPAMEEFARQWVANAADPSPSKFPLKEVEGML